MRCVMKLAAIALGLMLASPAAAVTLDFEQYIDETLMTSDSGLTFDNLSSLDTRQLPNSGYAHAVTSGNNIAFNPSGGATTITSTDAFHLVSANLGAAWNDGLTVVFTGSLHGKSVYSQSFVVDTTAASFIRFRQKNVDTIVVSTFGGVHNPIFGDDHGTQFSLDDLTYDIGLTAGGNVGNGGDNVGGVPEPAAWALMVAGFGLVGVAARRRVRATA